jgi:hypothetical protein
MLLVQNQSPLVAVCGTCEELVGFFDLDNWTSSRLLRRLLWSSTWLTWSHRLYWQVLTANRLLRRVLPSLLWCTVLRLWLTLTELWLPARFPSNVTKLRVAHNEYITIVQHSARRLLPIHSDWRSISNTLEAK